MRTTKTKMSLVVSFMFFCGLFWLAAPVVQAAELDLGALAAFNYAGKDKGNKQAGCHLSVSEIGRDMMGRFYQDFRVWVDGRPELNFSVRLKGAARYVAPQRIIGNQAEYLIGLDSFGLILLSDAGNPPMIQSFRFVNNAITIEQTGLVDCQGVRVSKQ